MIYGQEYLLRVQITTASYLNMVADNIYEYETLLYVVHLCLRGKIFVCTCSFNTELKNRF